MRHNFKVNKFLQISHIHYTVSLLAWYQISLQMSHLNFNQSASLVGTLINLIAILLPGPLLCYFLL